MGNPATVQTLSAVLPIPQSTLAMQPQINQALSAVPSLISENRGQASLIAEAQVQGLLFGMEVRACQSLSPAPTRRTPSQTSRTPSQKSRIVRQGQPGQGPPPSWPARTAAPVSTPIASTQSRAPSNGTVGQNNSLLPPAQGAGTTKVPVSRAKTTTTAPTSTGTNPPQTCASGAPIARVPLQARKPPNKQPPMGRPARPSCTQCTTSTV